MSLGRWRPSSDVLQVTEPSAAYRAFPSPPRLALLCCSIRVAEASWIGLYSVGQGRGPTLPGGNVDLHVRERLCRIRPDSKRCQCARSTKLLPLVPSGAHAHFTHPHIRHHPSRTDDGALWARPPAASIALCCHNTSVGAARCSETRRIDLCNPPLHFSKTGTRLPVGHSLRNSLSADPPFRSKGRRTPCARCTNDLRAHPQLPAPVTPKVTSDALPEEHTGRDSASRTRGRYRSPWDESPRAHCHRRCTIGWETPTARHDDQAHFHEAYPKAPLVSEDRHVPPATRPNRNGQAHARSGPSPLPIGPGASLQRSQTPLVP